MSPTSQSDLLNSSRGWESFLKQLNGLLSEWDFLPPQNYNKDRIRYYIDKCSEVHGQKHRIFWVRSPKELRSRIWDNISDVMNASRFRDYVQKCFAGIGWHGPDRKSDKYYERYMRLLRLKGVMLSSSILTNIRSILDQDAEIRIGSHNINDFMDRLNNTSMSIFPVIWDSSPIYATDKGRACWPYMADAYKAGLFYGLITDTRFYALPTPKYYLNNDCRLHSEDGPAVIWHDGEEEWWLNNVLVTKEIAETSAEELDSRLLLTEKNADVKREILRKIGIERVCDDFKAKCVDACGDYELLMLDIGDKRRRPYLKMRNPSLGVYHIEGVHPSCDTVRKALTWRNGSESYPEALS